MIPYPTSGLKMLADRVLSTVVPALGSKFAMSDTAMLALLIGALAEEMESGIARRLEDINAMHGLLLAAQSAGIEIQSPQVDEAAPYTLTRVNECHDAMTRALITVHCEVESEVESSEDYTELNRDIWQYLHAASERHKLPL